MGNLGMGGMPFGSQRGPMNFHGGSQLGPGGGPGPSGLLGNQGTPQASSLSKFTG